MTTSHLVGIVRDEFDRVKKIHSSTDRFQSERNLDIGDTTFLFGPGWLPDRVMKIIPLYISSEKVKQRKLTDDYKHLPKDLTDTFQRGILRTSGKQATDYSILMSVTEKEEKIPEGRTGVLLYKGKPVTVNIEGKEFVVEIKGVGCPDGDNTRILTMSRSDYFGECAERYGCLAESEGNTELENLEFQRNKSKTFKEGDAVRAAALIIYDNNLTHRSKKNEACLIRLAPSNVRSSFNSNPAFPKIKSRGTLLATSLGEHYAELANLEGTLLHSTIHPENILFTGKRYVLTDFADCRRLDQIEDPHDFLNKVLNKIKEVPGLTEKDINTFYKTIADRLGVEWDEQTGYTGFVDSIWASFFAPKVYDIVKGKEIRATPTIDGCKYTLGPILEKGREVPLSHLFIDGAKSFLEREIDLLQHVDTPEAKESVKVARKKIDYLSKQLDNGTDINLKFEENRDSFYDLFILPYMGATCERKEQ